MLEGLYAASHVLPFDAPGLLPNEGSVDVSEVLSVQSDVDTPQELHPSASDASLVAPESSALKSAAPASKRVSVKVRRRSSGPSIASSVLKDALAQSKRPSVTSSDGLLLPSNRNCVDDAVPMPQRPSSAAGSGSHRVRSRGGPANAQIEMFHRQTSARLSSNSSESVDGLGNTLQRLSNTAPGPVAGKRPSLAKTRRLPPGLPAEAVERVKARARALMPSGYGVAESKTQSRLVGLFDRIDEDGVGNIDLNEFKKAVRSVLLLPVKVITDSQITKLFGLLDTNSSGEISLDEFKSFVFEDANDEEGSAAIAAIKARMHEREVAVQRLPVGVAERLQNRLNAAANLEHDGSLEALIMAMDRDFTGTLDLEEVRHAFRKVIGVPPAEVSDAQIADLCTCLDQNRSGMIDIWEMVEFVQGASERKLEQKRLNAKMALEKFARERREADEAQGVSWSARLQNRRYSTISSTALECLQKKCRASVLSKGLYYQLLDLVRKLHKHKTDSIDDIEMRLAMRRILQLSLDDVTDDEILALGDFLDPEQTGTVDICAFVSFVGAFTDDLSKKRNNCQCSSQMHRPELVQLPPSGEVPFVPNHASVHAIKRRLVHLQKMTTSQDWGLCMAKLENSRVSDSIEGAEQLTDILRNALHVGAGDFADNQIAILFRILASMGPPTLSSLRAFIYNNRRESNYRKHASSISLNAAGALVVDYMSNKTSDLPIDDVLSVTSQSASSGSSESDVSDDDVPSFTKPPIHRGRKHGMKEASNFLGYCMDFEPGFLTDRCWPAPMPPVDLLSSVADETGPADECRIRLKNFAIYEEMYRDTRAPAMEEEGRSVGTCQGADSGDFACNDSSTLEREASETHETSCVKSTTIRPKLSALQNQQRAAKGTGIDIASRRAVLVPGLCAQPFALHDPKFTNFGKIAEKEASKVSRSRISSARDYYRRELGRFPTQYTAIVNLACCEALLGRPRAAISLFRRGVTQSPAKSTAHINLVLCLLLLQDSEGCAAAITEAFSRAKDLTSEQVALLHHCRSSLLFRAEKWEQAAAEVMQAAATWTSDGLASAPQSPRLEAFCRDVQRLRKPPGVDTVDQGEAATPTPQCCYGRKHMYSSDTFIENVNDSEETRWTCLSLEEKNALLAEFGVDSDVHDARGSDHVVDAARAYKQVRSLIYFRRHPPDQGIAFLRNATLLQAKVGTYIFRQGDPADMVYVVISGSVTAETLDWKYGPYPVPTGTFFDGQLLEIARNAENREDFAVWGCSAVASEDALLFHCSLSCYLNVLGLREESPTCARDGMDASKYFPGVEGHARRNEGNEEAKGESPGSVLSARVQCLQKTEFFEKVTSRDLERFATNVKEIQLRYDDIVFDAGSLVQGCYVIMEGILHLSAPLTLADAAKTDIATVTVSPPSLPRAPSAGREHSRWGPRAGTAWSRTLREPRQGRFVHTAGQAQALDIGPLYPGEAFGFHSLTKGTPEEGSGLDLIDSAEHRSAFCVRVTSCTAKILVFQSSHLIYLPDSMSKNLMYEWASMPDPVQPRRERIVKAAKHNQKWLALKRKHAIDAIKNIN